MPTVKMHGNGLFFEYTRTPEERDQIRRNEEHDRLIIENKELHDRLSRLEAVIAGMVNKEVE